AGRARGLRPASRTNVPLTGARADAGALFPKLGRRGAHSIGLSVNASLHARPPDQRLEDARVGTQRGRRPGGSATDFAADLAAESVFYASKCRRMRSMMRSAARPSP